jgi:hypothetical protein
MTWSYTGPASSSADAVRFLVGDTVEADPLLSDEEIAWLLTEHGNIVGLAAVQACETIAAKFARLADSQVDDVAAKASQRAAGYRTLAADLRGRVTVAGAMPFAGGISIGQKDTAEADTARVPPIFTRDMQVVSPSLPFSTETD